MRIEIKGRVFEIGDGRTIASRAAAENYAALCARQAVKGMTDGAGPAQSLVCALADAQVGEAVSVLVLGRAFGIGSNPQGRLQGRISGLRIE